MRWHGRSTISIRRTVSAVVVASVVTVALTDIVAAQNALELPIWNERLDTARVLLFSGLLGAVIFALVATIHLIRTRDRLEADNKQLTLRVGELNAIADRAQALVDDEDQRLVAWGAPGEPPMVVGVLPSSTGAPAERSAFLSFNTWLKTDSATRLERLLANLREKGEQFHQVVASSNGRMIEVRGRTVGGSAVARFRDLTGERLARARIEAQHDLLAAEVETTRAMLASAPMPIWLRDDDGALVWVNQAYAAAVEAKDDQEAVSHGLELLDADARRMIVAAHGQAPVFTRRMSAIVAGARRIYDIAAIRSEGGSAGMAIDVTEVEASRASLRREVEFNARTLDQLRTAVAIFGPDHRLRSYNAAYRALFDLDPGFLDSSPDEMAVLDRLRAARKLPEQADFRSWRSELLSAYRSNEAREQWWHMPDGQTLRVIANPHPQGGATWIYENVTEQLDLESRYNALVSVQGETLDHLSEGVAVFGSDGRLRLNNPAFRQIWALDKALLAGRPHVSDIVAACRRAGDDEGMWRRFTACVAGLEETRASISGRMERPDGRVIDYATVPLPDGQTMVTFVDVTDSIKVERALRERNEALEAADSLKNAFIHHVSYELRSPLTNIIGFSQLLDDARVGPLTDRQREYNGYIMASSETLLAIVNDILDLSSIDAGIMDLDLGDVDVADVIASAVEPLRNRADEAGIRIAVDVPADVGRMVADSKRLRQIVHNLLSNAVAFSPDNTIVRLSARRDGDSIEIAVSDRGAGIPSSFLSSVFDRFAAMPRGAGRGGVGLGLAIVKSFVALHGGTVEIASEEGKGTVARVRLPIRPRLDAAAAE